MDKTTDHQQLAKKLVDLASQKQITIAAAESCTGGALSTAITQIAGASRVFLGSIISYSNEAKFRILQVSEESLNRQGPVSEVVAKEMLIGLLTMLHADLAVSVTGLAGPEGGSAELPIGTVFVALGGREDNIEIFRLALKGNRTQIIYQTVSFILEKMLQKLGDTIH